MGTKASPSAYDCYANAEPDEPLFVLLARDPLAEYLVAAWAAMRARDVSTAVRMILDGIVALGDKPDLPYQSEKSVEAQQCSKAMREWRLALDLKRLEEK